MLLKMELDQPQGQAIAIKGDQIFAVGDDDDILTSRGTNTMVIDLKWYTLMPGFVDTHSHVFNEWAHDPPSLSPQ
jgi:predicted amidohydrolase YtcJ